MQPLVCTLVQLAAGRSPEQNRAMAWKHLYGGPAADLIVLPETFVLRASAAEQREAAEPIPGPTTEFLATAARKRNAWIAAGLLERDGPRVYNSLVVISRAGALAARYRKIHLFDAVLPSGKSVRESDTFTAGDEPVMAAIEGWRCGLSVCYDLRFPELYRSYAGFGAHILLAPSAFTTETGRAHWQLLVRARAVENLCFVLAPNQCGPHPHSGVEAYGHSLAVDPWGETLAEAGTDDCRLTVTLDPARIDQARARLPALRHRRLP